MLLARDLGLQIETKTIGKKGGKKFIPKDVIRDVIIHEVNSNFKKLHLV